MLTQGCFGVMVLTAVTTRLMLHSVLRAGAVRDNVQNTACAA